MPLKGKKRRFAFPLVLAAVLAGLLVAAGVAVANHVHPANGGAKTLTFTVVPAFKACTTGTTGTHGSPLAAPSCRTTSSSAESATLTTGAGASFKMASSFLIQVFCTNGQAPPCSNAGDQEDVKLVASATDVRCKSSIGSNTALCGPTNSAGGKDYKGQVQGNATIRITDHFNTAGTASCSSTTSCSATVVDLPFPVTGTCASNTDGTIGSTCSVTTTADAVVPGSGGVVKENKKANVEIGQILVNDGGSDGLASTAPNTVFARQGIYIP
jgi:hypothetical protein